MHRLLCLIPCLLWLGCGSAAPPPDQEVLRNNLSDFQGGFCDQGNYGSLWDLLTWTRTPRTATAHVQLRVDPDSETLHAELQGVEGGPHTESLSYEYRPPYLWIQRHFEISGWPQQFWMRLGVNEDGLVVVPPEEELEAPFRAHLRVSTSGSCVSTTSD